MGFAVAGATAIVFTAVAIAGTAVTAELLDSMSATGAAERTAVEQAHQVAATRITIVSVQRTGNTVTVTADNAGTTTLDATEVQLLAGGVYKTLTSVKVENSASNTVWAPGNTLELKFTQNTTPTTVTLIPENGSIGHWGG